VNTQINAYAIDGGKNINYIIINTGLINFVQNDDELAMVIGHEIAHLTKNHARQRLGTQIVRDEIIRLIYARIAQSNISSLSDQQLFNQIMGLGGEAALLKFNRANEEEADSEGAKYAASVGYNPDMGYNYFTRISTFLESYYNSTPAYLRTHPYSEDRAKTFIAGNYRAKYYRPFDDHSRQNPDLALAYNNRGITYYNNGNYEMAAADFSQASSIRPGDPTFRSNLANANNRLALRSSNPFVDVLGTPNTSRSSNPFADILGSPSTSPP
jgi:predicted Zn-dependent protease